MKVTRHEGKDERIILTGMITDDSVLGNVNDKWDGQLFGSKWSNIVAEWCCDYFDTYSKAPNGDIEGLFSTWASGTKDKATIKLVEEFLTQLSGNYKRISKKTNTRYVIDKASRHFNRIQMARLAEELTADLDRGKVKGAIKRVAAFNKIEMGAGSAINMLADKQAIRDAFDEKDESLIVYPDALGVFFKKALQRDALIAAMGPEKSAKTFWLMDMTWRAVEQGRKTAFFAVGDMSQNQMVRRFATRGAQRPLQDGIWRIPTAMTVDPMEDTPEVSYKEEAARKPMTKTQAWKGFQKLKRGGDNFKLSCHPNSSINVAGIRSILSGWERNGWVPDVVVIDYADILAPPSGSGQESREQVNATWKQLRALSQANHCLVLTATQADAQSYNANTLSRSNFSEDKRKMAHVTGLFGLNSTDEERKAGCMRLNWIVLRDSPFSASDVVHTAGSLAVANPSMLSSF